MSRPKSSFATTIISKLLTGMSPKEIAFETNMTASAVSKIIANTSGLRKQYVTETEYNQILKNRIK